MKIFLRLLKSLVRSERSGTAGRFRVPLWFWIVLAILLGALTIASNVALLSMAAYLIAAAAIVPFIALLTIPMFIVRFAGAARPLARYAERLLSHSVVFRLLARLRVEVYRRLEPQAPAHLLRYRSGDLLARLTGDIDELQNLYLRVLTPIAVALLITLLTGALLLIFHPLLTGVALLFLGLAGVGLPLLAVRLTRGLGRRQLALRSEQKAHIIDSLQGMTDLLAYGYERELRRRVIGLDDEQARIQGRLARINGWQEALHDLLLNLGVWTMLLLATVLIAAQMINAVYLGFLGLLVLASFEAIQPLGQAFALLGHALAAGKRLFALTDREPAIREKERPLPLPTGETGEWVLEFEQMGFGYEKEEEEVLSDISFQIRPGQRIALVGPSGAGKSTLLRLALRFWDPTRGTIRLNGQDVRDFALVDLRGLFGVVAQDTYLFNDTLRRNLRLARPEASDEELLRVLEQAKLDEFVRQLPHGLDTWIGEQGQRLSGGERQRLAIARALLKGAPVLLLDEVTANLDPLTERALLDTLTKLMRGRTALFVTHRLVCMENMDEILVLRAGRVCERGTHEQLLAANGLYRQLFDTQNDEIRVL